MPGAKAKHEEARAQAQAAYERALAEHDELERAREQELSQAKAAHEAEAAKIVARAEEDNREVDELKEQFAAGVPDAVVTYFSLVLDASSYPETFSRHHRIAFVPESKQLVIELELPAVDVVPRAGGTST